MIGCTKSYKTQDNNIDNNHQIENFVAVAESLQNENLPALEAIVPWQNGYGTGLKLITAHYEIFTTLLEPLMLRRIPGFVESAYQAYNNQLAEPVRTTAKLRIYLFVNRGQWEDFTKTFAGSQAEIFSRIKAGAYYLNDACVAYYIGADRTLAALGHEGWHQFTGRYFKFRLPSWLDEGIAMMFEASRYSDGLLYFEPGDNSYRLEMLSGTFSQATYIPLSELIAINPGEALATDQAEAVQAFYSQSYALVRFLKEANGGKYLDKFHRLLSDGLTGDWPISQDCRRIAADRNIPRTIEWNRVVGTFLFEHYISRDVEQVEKEYLTFCRRLVSYPGLKTQD